MNITKFNYDISYQFKYNKKISYSHLLDFNCNIYFFENNKRINIGLFIKQGNKLFFWTEEARKFENILI